MSVHSLFSNGEVGKAGTAAPERPEQAPRNETRGGGSVGAGLAPSRVDGSIYASSRPIGMFGSVWHLDADEGLVSRALARLDSGLLRQLHLLLPLRFFFDHRIHYRVSDEGAPFVPREERRARSVAATAWGGRDRCLAGRPRRCARRSRPTVRAAPHRRSLRRAPDSTPSGSSKNWDRG